MDWGLLPRVLKSRRGGGEGEAAGYCAAVLIGIYLALVIVGIIICFVLFCAVTILAFIIAVGMAYAGAYFGFLHFMACSQPAESAADDEPLRWPAAALRWLGRLLWSWKGQLTALVLTAVSLIGGVAGLFLLFDSLALFFNALGDDFLSHLADISSLAAMEKLWQIPLVLLGAWAVASLVAKTVSRTDPGLRRFCDILMTVNGLCALGYALFAWLQSRGTASLPAQLAWLFTASIIANVLCFLVVGLHAWYYLPRQTKRPAVLASIGGAAALVLVACLPSMDLIHGLNAQIASAMFATLEHQGHAVITSPLLSFLVYLISGYDNGEGALSAYLLRD